MEMAKFLAAKTVTRQENNADCDSGHTGSNELTILKGIYPSLNKIVREQMGVVDDILGEKGYYTKPDAACDPSKMTVDPFGNDFFCKLCSRELSNIYFHCDGCEHLLHKDFNICIDCYKRDDRRHLKFQMNPYRPFSEGQGCRSDYNHTPHHTKNAIRKGGDCRCKQGPVCRRCGYMTCCSCKCHKEYSLHMRFMNRKHMESLISKVKHCLYNSTGNVDASVDIESCPIAISEDYPSSQVVDPSESEWDKGSESNSDDSHREDSPKTQQQHNVPNHLESPETESAPPSTEIPIKQEVFSDEIGDDDENDQDSRSVSSKSSKNIAVVTKEYWTPYSSV